MLTKIIIVLIVSALIGGITGYFIPFPYGLYIGAFLSIIWGWNANQILS